MAVVHFTTDTAWHQSLRLLLQTFGGSADLSIERSILLRGLGPSVRRLHRPDARPSSLVTG